MSLHNDNALVVALDTSTDMLACAASWIDGQTGETKLVSGDHMCCLLYTSPSPRDRSLSRMPSSA